ncbi:MAG: class I SAM-dependent methyltransferase [Deltaproteobacteria bacterium]
MDGPRMSLTPDELGAVKAALTGPHGASLMELMHRLTTGGRPKGDFSDDVLTLAEDLGWIDRGHFATKLGWKMGDPIRELVNWNKRDRKVHDWEQLPVLRAEHFEGKDLLSIGCGCGTNLFSFQTMCKSVVGLEVEPIYLQFTPIWAELSGVPTPKTVHSGAEHMPFDDGSFDVIVCLGALQYMNIQRVLHEVSRVLRPGGMAIFTLSDLRGYVTELSSRVFTFRRPQQFIREGAMFANMIVYPWVGRVIVRPFDPVYPRVKRIRRWFADADLDMDDTLTVPYQHEYCYVVRRR